MYITLTEGQFGWDYYIETDGGQSLLIQSDWEYPALAMAFGWSPCRHCRRLCHGQTDGTVSCARRSVSAHITSAQAWLDGHIGARVADPGYFE